MISLLLPASHFKAGLYRVCLAAAAAGVASAAPLLKFCGEGVGIKGCVCSGWEDGLGMAIELLTSSWETASQLRPSTAPPWWGLLTRSSLWTSGHGGLRVLSPDPQCSRWAAARGSAFEEACLIQGGLWSLVSLPGVGRVAVLQEPFQFPVPCDAASPGSGGRCSRRNNTGGFPVSSL